MNENSGGTPGGTPEGTPNPLNPTPLQPIEPETPETPEMMAGPWNDGAAAEKATAEAVPAVESNTETQENSAVATPVAGITADAALAAGQAGIAAGRAHAMRAARTPQMTSVAHRTRPGKMQDVMRPAEVNSNAAPTGAQSTGLDAVGYPTTGTINTAGAAAGTGVGITGVPSLSAMHRTTEPMPIPKDSVVGAKGKKRHGWLIALVVLLLAAIGAAVAAVMILKPFDSQQKDDRVATAIDKLLADKPQKLSLKGSLMVTPQNSSPYSQLLIKFDSGLDLKNKQNFANATVQMTMRDGGEFDFELEEIQTADGDTFIRLNGIAEMMASYMTTIEPADNVTADLDPNMVTNCVSDAGGSMDSLATTNCLQAQTEPLFTGLTQMIEMLDNEWIRIPDGGAVTTDMIDMDEDMVCLVKALPNLSGVGEIYQAHPFITSSMVDQAANKSRNPAYKLGVDSEIYDEFDSAFRNSAFMSSYRSCMNSDSSMGGATAQRAYLITGIDKATVEIDDNDNITRLILTPTSDVALISLDTEIGYPTSVTVDEPTYYTDLSQLMEEIFSQLYATE